MSFQTILKQKLLSWLISYHSELEQQCHGVRKLLDVGCGANSPIRHFKTRINYTVGVDGFLPSIEESRRLGIHDDYRLKNVLDIDREFLPRSFDCVLASDLIEHLNKEQGLELLKKMERISSGSVIVFTPNGFLAQGEHSNNPLQRHVSGWSVEEMKSLGYEVIGIGGWKPLLGPMAIPRFRPRLFWLFIARLTQPMVRRRPEHAFQLLCVKRVEQN